jgi:hypothetical protein
MSTEKLKRQLRARSRGRTSAKPAGDAHDAAVAARARRKAAIVAMVAFARHLAGTAMQAPGAAPPVKPRRKPKAKPRPPEPRQRLDMHTEATLEQVLKEEWVDSTTEQHKPGPPPRPDPGFEAWDPIIPSYARKPEEDDK